VVDESIPVEIIDKDLKIDTFRSSGAGGQHVNKTESAIRITHMPSGIVVACQQERSQHKNRAKAMEMLRAKLYEMELKKREDAAAVIEAQKPTSPGPPDSLLRFTALSNGQGRPHRRRNKPGR